jgi:CheY-like chemotaxis protein
MIFVIDDEASIRTLLRGVLEQAGHQVVEAHDGREALDLYQKNRPDLVIMD